MASLKQKKKLIEKIKHPIKKYRLVFSRYGGEAVMGTITREQYEYWNGQEEQLKEYVMGWDRQEYEDQNDIPNDAKINRDWFELDNVVHCSGVELADSNQLYIEEYDHNDKLLKTGKSITLSYKDIEKAGITLDDGGELYDADHEKVMNQCYFFGQSTEKGGWTNDTFVETDELDFKKITLHYKDIEGFKIINSFSVSGIAERFELSGDGNDGGDTYCRVLEGWQNPKKQSKKKEPSISDFIAPEYVEKIQKSKKKTKIKKKK